MRLRPVLVVLALVVGLAGCGGGSSTSSKSTPSPTPSPVDPKVAITQVWEGFFNPAASIDQHVAWLQDGEKFRAELTANSKDPAAKDLSAKVKSVVVAGPTALVTYDLLGKNGAVLLNGAQGSAVNLTGTWQVSKKTYCQLIALQNPTVKHPGCTG
ncbi:MAG: hypothetical protein WCD35_13075 [Mycobacteriales bacterium]